MKWLKSTTMKSYTAEGKIIPSMNGTPLAVSDDVYEKITKMAVIKSLISTGNIIVLDRYNDKQVAGDKNAQKLQLLHQENAQLQARIHELESNDAESRLKALQEKYDALEAEANQKLAESAEALASANQKLAKLESKHKNSAKDD